MSKTIYRAEYRHFVERLRVRRERLGLSQSDLAERVGWKQQKISLIELGARRLDVLEYIALAKALDLSPASALLLAAKFAPPPKTRPRPAGLKIKPGPKPKR